jgi:hypothetical protein
MASTYTTNLGIEKIATGEQSGTWGATTNTNLDLIDQAVNGVVQITVAATGSTGSPNALTITNGSASDGRNKFIDFYSPTDLGGTVYYQLDPNDAEKIAFVRNSLGGGQTLVLFQGTYNASNDVEVPNGVDMLVKFDGTGASATVTNVFEKLQVNALSVNDGNITNVGDIALDSISADGTDINVSVSDNSATALTVKEGANTYLTIDTTNSAEKVLVSKTLDVGDNNITNVGNIALDSISADGTQIDIDITDNTASAFTISEGANNYIAITTTDGSELITVSKNSTFAGTTIADLGVVTTVDINGGTIDGVTIGGASAGAGTFANLKIEANNGSSPVDPINKLILKDTDTAAINGQYMGEIQFESSDTDNAGVMASIHAAQRGTLGGGNLVFETSPDTAANKVTRINISQVGDISFYEDTGTTPKFFWDASTERLGLGTTSPVTQSGGEGIHINGSANSELKFTNSTTGSISTDGTSLVASSNNFIINNREAGYINLSTSNTERLRIDSSGNVGIGTTSPSVLVEASKSQNAVTDIKVTNANTGTAAQARLTLGNSGSNIGALGFLGGSFTTSGVYRQDGVYVYSNGVGGLTLLTGAAQPIYFATNSAEGMRLTSGGTLQIAGGGNDSVGEINMGNTAQNANRFQVRHQSSAWYLKTVDSEPLVFGTANTERMRLDASGNLGLGVTPSAWSSGKVLEIGNTGNSIWGNSAANFYLTENAYYNSGWKYASSNGAATYQMLTNSHIWSIAASGTAGDAITFAQPMTLDASGNLLVGKTSQGFGTSGTEIRADDSLYVTRTDTTAFFNRLSTDGDIVKFYKDSSTVGSIASSGDSGIIVGTTDVGLRFRNQSAGAAIFPRELDDTALDNAVDLGTSGSRFKDLYLSGSVYLGGTTSANALDDYEEGTWTPVLNRTTLGTVTYTLQTGYYVKIGRVVYVWGKVTWSNISSVGSGNNYISGLPFSAGIGQANGWPNFGGSSGVATNPVLAGLFYNQTVYLRKSANILADGNIGEDYNNSGTFGFNGMYNIL